MKNLCRLILLFITLGLSGCLESSFELADGSRLPSWFSPPAGKSREDVKITLDYYTNGNAVFKIFGKNDHIAFEKITGNAKNEKPIQLEKPADGFPKHYPMYQIVTINGVTEVIEHRAMEPIFYITDDPIILKELGVTRK